MASFVLGRPPAWPKFPMVVQFQFEQKCTRKLKHYLNRFVAGFVFCAIAHGIYVISADTLIEEALKAYQSGEVSQKSTMLTSQFFI